MEKETVDIFRIRCTDCNQILAEGFTEDKAIRNLGGSAFTYRSDAKTIIAVFCSDCMIKIIQRHLEERKVQESISMDRKGRSVSG